MSRPILLLVLLLLSCTNTVRNKAPEHQMSDLDTWIVDWLDKTEIPSVSFVLIKNGEIFHAGALGLANVKKGTPADTETIYNTGSNFKPVTATAVMQLHERKLIHIDSPVNKYLRAPVQYYDPERPITARHLMSHQAGLPTSVEIRRLWDRKEIPSLEELRGEIKPLAGPGEVYQYSNDGYSLLGLLIENVSGVPYEKYIWKNVLEPLGIEHNGFLSPTPEMIEDLALPYHMRYNQSYPTHQLQLAQYPAGDVYLTPLDMAKFIQAHLNNGSYRENPILGPQSILEMHQPEAKVQEGFEYGLGFGLGTLGEKTYSSHQGSLPGYLSAFRMDREKSNAVYLATNVSASPLQEKQVQLLLDILMGFLEDGQIRVKEIPVDRNVEPYKTPINDLNVFIGKYRIENSSVDLVIELAGNKLFLINPAEERFYLERMDGFRFFLTTENEDLVFFMDAADVLYLSLHSGRNTIKANKIKE